MSTARWKEPAVHAGAQTVTLISGLTFAVSGPTGDIDAGHSGIIAGDTRHLSRLVLQVDGEPIQLLGAVTVAPGEARFVGVAGTRGDSPDPPLEVNRLRRVEEGRVFETVRLDWWGDQSREVLVQVTFDADFADIFEVRALDADTGQLDLRHPVRVDWNGAGVDFTEVQTKATTRVHADPPADGRSAEQLVWNARLQRHQAWQLQLTIEASTRLSATAVEHPAPHNEAQVHSIPQGFGRACARSLGDLDALSLRDPLEPGRYLTTAGIPWFVALFGRDSLIAARQGRMFRPRRMLDTLQALAARQGAVDDPDNDEQPGKILHEVRLTPRPWLGQTGGAAERPYYGSVDATPLFLMTYGAALRWGAPLSGIRALLPAARGALAWLRDAGDVDGDGLIEYQALGPRSLANQGWKDSGNAIQFADGRLAEGPIALVEVQGYAYRARLELAEVLRAFGEPGEADELVAEAAELREVIRRRFWMPAKGGAPGCFALALDGDKQQVDAIASNQSHLLWCGVPNGEEARQVAQVLAGSTISSGWGLRTLASTMAGYNPLGYHVGSVWPHDTAIACEGLCRYGLHVVSHRLAGALLDALDLFELSLPELFGGQARTDGDAPVPYPTACRPQAWAAGVPLQLATVFLGLEPQLTERRIVLAPSLPPRLERLVVRDLRFPTGVLSVAVSHTGGTELLEQPAGIAVEVAPPLIVG